MVQFNGIVGLNNGIDKPLHSVKKQDINVEESFGKLLSKTLNQVNQNENDAVKMQLNAILNPESVHLHEVTTLMAKASMGVMITKAVTERVINAYKEITHMR